MVYKHIFDKFLNEPELIFYMQLYSYKYIYLTLIILSIINYLLEHSYMVLRIITPQ